MQKLTMRSAALVLALAGALMEPATAQTAPSYGSALGSATLDGVVVRFTEGSFELGLRDDNGFYDNVRLHDRTIIFPIGMRIRIVGFSQGAAFTANEIDVPRPARISRVHEPRWYAQWNASSGYRNPPAPAFVNPPAQP
jgi:hypothetical protein